MTMSRILRVLAWRVRFAMYGYQRRYWRFLDGWAWSGECWRDWCDERCGLADYRDAAKEEIYTARLEA
jgi:hypothetical protein